MGNNARVKRAHLEERVQECFGVMRSSFMAAGKGTDGAF